MKELVNPPRCYVAGYQINYFREGHGETVLLVHGIITCSFICAEIVHSLKSSYIPDAGHDIQFDVPGKLAGTLLQFMKGAKHAA